MAKVLSACEASGVPCGPVNRAKEMLEDAHIKARQAIIRMVHPVMGEVPMQGVFPKLSETPGKAARPAPAMGEHTDDILQALGKSTDELSDLRARGII